MRDLIHQILFIFGLGSVGALAILLPSLVIQIFARDPVAVSWLGWAIVVDLAVIGLFFYFMNKN